eukprot:UN05997
MTDHARTHLIPIPTLVEIQVLYVVTDPLLLELLQDVMMDHVLYNQEVLAQKRPLIPIPLLMKAQFVVMVVRPILILSHQPAEMEATLCHLVVFVNR